MSLEKGLDKVLFIGLEIDIGFKVYKFSNLFFIREKEKEKNNNFSFIMDFEVKFILIFNGK